MVAPGTYTLAELDGGRLRRRPPGPAPTATAAPSTRARSRSPPATSRSPARSPTTTSRSSSIIEKVVVNDDGGTRGRRTTSASPPAPARSSSAPPSRTRPTPSPTPPRRSQVARRHVHPRRARRWPATTPTAWTCTNGGGGAFDAGTVTVAAGDEPVTCSITNDDQPVELIIEKTVVNDDGGTAVVDDFGITTSAGALAFGAAVEDPADTFTYTAETLVGRGRHVHPRRARRWPATTPTAWTCTNGDGGAFDAGTVTVAAGDEPVTCSITNDDQPVELDHREGRRQRRRRQAVVDDFGITTSAGALVFGAAVEDPADTFTYTAETLAVAPGTYTLAELDVAGYDADRLDLHQRRRRRLRRGHGHGRRRRRAGDLLDHQRRPAGRAHHRQDRHQRRRRQRRSSDDFGITTNAGALAFGAAVEDPADVFTYTAETLASPPARTPSPSSTWPATRRPPGPAPTAAAARSTRARSRSPPATSR